MIDLNKIGLDAKAASRELGCLGTNEKNMILAEIAANLLESKDHIIKQNLIDIEEARKSGLSEVLIDRLMLNEGRIEGMRDSIQKILDLEDPIGEYVEMRKLPNGLAIGKRRVPLGVVGIIYESRPNVTIDAASLCLKSGNALILRGGKEAYHSNICLTNIVRETLEKLNYNPNSLQYIEDQSYDVANRFMQLHQYVDVLIPRGGYNLIQTVVKNSTIPIIETGIGNCHVYVDKDADIEMAINIIINAKTQRSGVCNAMESLLIHKDIAEDLVPKLTAEMTQRKVRVLGDEKSVQLDSHIQKASEEDWGKEYLDLVYSQKIVESLDEAIQHINTYGTGHSEVIITKSYDSARIFMDQVDAAAVYVNASSRFTDGFEFGMGAEMGISTQKLHARGPVGLKEMTTTKYTIFGNGQIRE